MTLILDTTVFGFRSVIEKVVSLVVLVISLLPFTEYLIVYLLRMPLRGTGSLQDNTTLKYKIILSMFLTTEGPATKYQYANYDGPLYKF